MILTKDGITVEVIHPLDVFRYKGIGYVEVQESESQEPEPDKEPEPVAKPEKAVKAKE